MRTATVVVVVATVGVGAIKYDHGHDDAIRFGGVLSYYCYYGDLNS